MVCRLWSHLILNPRIHCNSPPSAILKCFWISVLSFTMSKYCFSIMAILSVTTTIIVCSSPCCQKKIEWSTANCWKPSLSMNTAVGVFCHSQPACFNPYNTFLSLQTIYFLDLVSIFLLAATYRLLYQVAHLSKCFSCQPDAFPSPVGWHYLIPLR